MRGPTSGPSIIAHVGCPARKSPALYYRLLPKKCAYDERKRD
jgi:hypothetical protein